MNHLEHKLNNVFKVKKIILLLLTIWSFSFLQGQSNDWKPIQTPKLSNIDILYQNQKGEVIARTYPFVGIVKSVDACQTWNFVDDDAKIYGGNQLYNESSSGEIIYYRYPNIYWFDPKTNEISIINGPGNGNISQMITLENDFIIASTSNTIYVYNRDTLLKSQFHFNKIYKLLDANLPDKAFCIYVINNIHYLYQIDRLGELKRISTLDSNGKRYFYHNNTLIRDNKYSVDLGQTWTQYDLPFTEPDTIFKYNNMLAFGKENKIYFKTENATYFNVITLPSETNLLNTYIGKYIITEDINKFDSKILKQSNGNFEPVSFDIATPYVDFFAAGFDEKIISTYGSDLYLKNDKNSPWSLLPIKSSQYQRSISFSEDRAIDLIDDEANVLSSFDDGVSWNTFKYTLNSRPSTLFSKKSAVFFATQDSIYYRKIDEKFWKSKRIAPLGGSELVEISNQAEMYKNHFGIEILTHLDTFGQSRLISDIPNFRYQTCTHYEMNTFYNIATTSYDNLTRAEAFQLSSTYDQGFSFDVLKDFPPSIDGFFSIKSTNSGHLIISKRKSLLISGDEGRSWQEINVGLNNRDYIMEISISPDHFIYISTAEKGILKYKYPLSKPNIVYVNLSEDAKGDCELSNDITPIVKQKISLKNLSTQLTDANGKAVFYSHTEQNKLFVHNENDILDLCKDTVSLNFGNGGGHVLIDTINAKTQKACAQLDVKVVNFSNIYYFGTSYTILIRNNGNVPSTSKELRILLDPYQRLDTQYTSVIVNKIGEGLYDLVIPAIAPSGEYSFRLSTTLLPYVPFDRMICISVNFKDQDNQCIPYQNIVKCNQVNRLNKNKTIAVKYFEDTNGNCLKDPTEKYTIGHFNTINNNRDFIVQYDSIKYIITSLDTNIITFKYNEKLYAFCKESYPIIINKDSFYHEIEIPFRTLDYCTDLQLYGAHGTLRPCFERTVSYTLFNDGNIPSRATSVSFDLDPELIVSNVYPTPVSVNGNIYIFLINELPIGSSLRFQFTVTVPCTAPIGEQYCFKAVVTESTIPSICQFHKEFTKESCIMSVGSYDPNDKTIFVSGIENKSSILKDDEIEYRIRFQNTGTDTAYTVRIEDKLSEQFDVTSIILTDFSHNCKWKVENAILIIAFNDINLVDSFTNSPGSIGFITFKIKLKETVKITDELRNHALIFFDFNDPIITNEVIRTFGSTVGTHDPEKHFQSSKIVNVIPNPTLGSFRVLMSESCIINEINIYNISGQSVKTFVNQKSSDLIDVSDLPSGIYIVKIQKANVSEVYGRLIKL